MLSFSGSLKVFVAVEACDIRKGFNGLHAPVAGLERGRSSSPRPASTPLTDTSAACKARTTGCS